MDGRSWRCGSPGTLSAELSLGALSGTGDVDLGCSRARLGAAGTARSAPDCQVTSVFGNSKGLSSRAGALIPGYAGFIPGKVAGNVFAKSFAQDNLQATQVRHGNYQKYEDGANWLLHSTVDRDLKSHGAFAISAASEAVATPNRTSSRDGGGGGWQLWRPEPVPAHVWAGHGHK